MINRTAPHLPVQNVGRAAYREILERWARASRADSVRGVATAHNAGGVLPDRGGEVLPDPRRHPVLAYRAREIQGLGID